MLFRYLRHLRAQPKTVRDTHAFFIASGCTVVIVAVWVLTLPGRFAPVSVSLTDTKERPLGSFFHQAREQFASVFGATASTTEEEVPSTANEDATKPLPTTIELSPEELEMARAAAAVPYTPPATTSPRVVRIATTTAEGSRGNVATSTTTTTR